MKYKNSRLNKELKDLENKNKPDKKRKPTLYKTEKDTKRQKLDEKEISKNSLDLFELRSMYHSRH